MNTAEFSPSVSAPVTTSRLSFLDRLTRRAVLDRLQRIAEGGVIVRDALGVSEFGHVSHESAITVSVGDARFYRRLMTGGSVGAGESFMDGEWSCDDLTALVRLLLRNESALSGLNGPLSWLAQLGGRLVHAWNRNTRSGSRRNIRAHYDLGNDFFETFLDETMCYSAAVFEYPEQSLFDASVAKLDRICRKLDLRPTDHLLEIGTGWGGLAIHAARKYGCRVTTTTISEQQHAWAVDAVREAGLESRITLLKSDYRDLAGRYDKLVSIEMIEAVGHDHFDTYFGKCSELLEPHGLMLLQAITAPEQNYDVYLRSVDFIRRHVFPGGCLPSMAAMMQSTARRTDLRPLHVEDIAPHYAETLRRWRTRFFDRIDDIRGFGYPERLLRMWDFYLCFCEAAFEERTVGDVQLLLGKPGCRHDPLATALPTVAATEATSP